MPDFPSGLFLTGCQTPFPLIATSLLLAPPADADRSDQPHYDPDEPVQPIRQGVPLHRGLADLSMWQTSFTHHSPQLPSRPPSTHTPWSGRGSWRPGGARHCTNDLDAMGRVCSALPGSTVDGMGVPRARHYGSAVGNGAPSIPVPADPPAGGIALTLAAYAVLNSWGRSLLRPQGGGPCAGGVWGPPPRGQPAPCAGT